jgi:hypothetical protein
MESPLFNSKIVKKCTYTQGELMLNKEMMLFIITNTKVDANAAVNEADTSLCETYKYSLISNRATGINYS